MKTGFVLILAMAALLLTGCGEEESSVQETETVQITAAETTGEQTETTAVSQTAAQAVGTVTFATRAVIDGQQTDTSVTATQTSIPELTDKELSDMQAVDDAIEALMGDINYMKVPLAQQAEKMGALLQSLATNGTKKAPYPLIVKLSILYDEPGEQFSFMYTCGVMGGVRLRPFDPTKN